MTLAVKRLIRDVARRLPELAHVRPSRILVVAGEARRASRASIRGLVEGPGRSRVVLQGRRVLYVITLRPLWFRESSAAERVATVLHELYHASTRFDGRLHRQRRHGELAPGAYGRRVGRLLQRYLAVAPATLLLPFEHVGPARARMWLERPTVRAAKAGRRVYGARQLYVGLVEMRGRGPGRRGARRPRGLDEEEWG